LRSAGLASDALDLIGCHGQTIVHLPGGSPPATLQAGSGPALAALIGVPVVFNFRAADVALGGQGAPLMPFVDWLLFNEHVRERPLGVLNLGGIANVTILPRGAAGPGDVIAFDTGPGNMIIDRLARDLMGRPFDRDGAVAAAGSVSDVLLADLLADPYFSRPLPKSAGREEFGGAFVARLCEAATGRNLRPADLLATATALTAASVAGAMRALAPAARPATLVLGGGGVRNPSLRAMLANALPDMTILQHEDFGWPSDLKEALGFALLADAAVRGVQASLPNVTGASAPLVLGAVAPGRPPKVWPDWIGDQ
jgi:anhydro-N-acetylmuramic acid kinase